MQVDSKIETGASQNNKTVPDSMIVRNLFYPVKNGSYSIGNPAAKYPGQES